jgi:hypothetical protein
MKEVDASSLGSPSGALFKASSLVYPTVMKSPEEKVN